ncbi:MAG: hypothetical protein J6Y20_12440 [Lachnospiraceae bacterium]|nr:hypothetical protein [Lachnospiraceae bacterium]
MNGRLKDLLRLSGGEWILSFVTRDDPRKLMDKLRDEDVTIEIKKAEKKRSKAANDLMWAMCTDIGNAMRPPIPKEEVYRSAIRDVGAYEPLPVRADAVERFQASWSSKGTGWFAEVIDDSKLPGYKLVFAYYGSSTYTTEEMSRLIDYLGQDMDSMGLPRRMSKEEEERTIAEWRGALLPRGMSKEDEERKIAEWQRASSKTSESATSAEG